MKKCLDIAVISIPPFFNFHSHLFSIIRINLYSLCLIRNQRMEKVALEIVIISAQDLKCVTSFGRRMRTYAVVWSDSSTQSCTRTDREGGSYPTWNDKFLTTVSKSYLQEKGSSLLVQIYCKSIFLGRKTKVGSVRVPYADVLEGFAKPDSIHFLSYRIRTPNGRPRGTLDLSLRFLDKTDAFLPSSTPQFQMKFPGFPSEPMIPASWRRQGYAIGVPLSNSVSSSANTSYHGYQLPHARLPPFNLQQAAASYTVHHSQLATYL